MTSRGRYLTVPEFCRLLGDLHITENIFQDRLLEFLEQHRLVVPAARARWPEDLVIEGRDGTSVKKNPQAVRESAQALSEAVRKYNGFNIDPAAEHPLDDAAGGPIVNHNVGASEFQSWKTFKVEVNPPGREPYLVDDAVDTYYHDWQALYVADAISMGVHFLFDTSAAAARDVWTSGNWAKVATLPAFKTWSIQSERGLNDGRKWFHAFDAAARAQIAQERAHTTIAWRYSGPPRYFDATEQAELETARKTSAKAAVTQAGLDEKAIYAFITYLCERWDEWARRDRQAIAGEYKRHINRAIGLLIYGFDRSYSEVVEKLGHVTSHFANTLDVIFPDERKEKRELLKNSLQYSVVKSAPTTDPDFVLTEAEVTDLLDWTERNAFYKAHISVEIILGAQYKGSSLDQATLAKEAESLSTTFEHMTNALLAEMGRPSHGTLKPKLMAFWTNDPIARQLIDSNWSLTQTNPPATLHGQLAALAAMTGGVRVEVARIILTAVLYRNSGQHTGMTNLSEPELHQATRVFLLAMMYLRKNLLNVGLAASAAIPPAGAGAP